MLCSCMHFFAGKLTAPWYTSGAAQPWARLTEHFTPDFAPWHKQALCNRGCEAHQKPIRAGAAPTFERHRQVLQKVLLAHRIRGEDTPILPRVDPPAGKCFPHEQDGRHTFIPPVQWKVNRWFEPLKYMMCPGRQLIQSLHTQCVSHMSLVGYL
jgi:hypothetical protein